MVEMVFRWRGLQFFELKQNILDESSNKTTLQCSKAWDPSSRGIWVALELWKFLENILKEPSHAPTNMENTSFWSSQKLDIVCKFLWESCLIATGTKIRSSLLCWAARGWWPSITQSPVDTRSINWIILQVWRWLGFCKIMGDSDKKCIFGFSPSFPVFS